MEQVSPGRHELEGELQMENCGCAGPDKESMVRYGLHACQALQFLNFRIPLGLVRLFLTLLPWSQLLIILSHSWDISFPVLGVLGGQEPGTLRHKNLAASLGI